MNNNINSGNIYRYSSDWIHKLETETHWRLYWQQQELMQNSIQSGQHVLEIGVGSGFTANYLRSKGIKVTTLDIDENKNPDIVANIVDYNWDSQLYDHILAFEVFEHIPFDEFDNFLAKLSKICRYNLFCSLPIAEYILLRFEVRLPILGNKSIKISLPRKKVSTDHHFWEIGTDQYSLKYLSTIFAKHQLKIQYKKEKLSRYYISIIKK